MAKFLKYLPYLSCFLSRKKLVELTFFVTDRCNFKCPFCFNENTNGRNELTLGEIEKFSKTIGPLLRLLISGGEPFLREDLSDVCKTFIRNCNLAHLTVPTNGFFTERITTFAQDICSVFPDTYINISLSLDELKDARDKLVGMPGSFERLINTHNGLRQLTKKYKNLGIGVITTQCKENENRLSEMHRFAKDVLRTDNFALSFARGRNGWEGQSEPDITIYRHFTQHLSDTNRSMLNFPFSRFYQAKRHLVYESVVNSVEKRTYTMPCFAGGLRAVISSTGDVFPCETFMFDGRRHKLGNLREAGFDFSKVWNSKEAKDARKYIKVSKCFCSHECDLTMNALFNLRNLPKLIFNRETERESSYADNSYKTN